MFHVFSFPKFFDLNGVFPNGAINLHFFYLKNKLPGCIFYLISDKIYLKMNKQKNADIK